VRNIGAEVTVACTNPIANKLIQQLPALVLGHDIFLQALFGNAVKERDAFEYVVHAPNLARNQRLCRQTQSRRNIGLRLTRGPALIRLMLSY